MTKYLHITEYSSRKIPNKKDYEYDLTTLEDNIIRSYVDNHREKIKENFDNFYNDSIIEEKTFPLNKVIIYDNYDLINEDQKVAYVFECPVCLEKTITTDPTYNYCAHCENDKFAPVVVGLINVEQMEEIAIEDADISTYILVKDGKIKIIEKPEIKGSVFD